MNLIKKLLFILSLITGQQLVKTGAQTEGGYFTTAATDSSTVPDCRGMYSNLSGTIYSPNYPSNYSNNLDCYYIISMSTANTVVAITFLSFDTQPYNDYLQVSCLIGSADAKASPRFTGSNLPPFLSIDCFILQLLFHTDRAFVAKGFNLTYNAGKGMEGGLTMKPTNSYVSSDSTEPTILSCSSRANQTDEYPWWSYSRDGSSFVVITAPDCSVLSSIYRSVPKYFSTSWEYSTRTCNLTISSLHIKDAIGLYYCTDATLDYAVALVDTIGCGGTYSDLSGTITSPNYPSSYDDNLDCFYYIQLPSNQTSVNITFISFDTEFYYDWLKVSCASNHGMPIMLYNQTFSGLNLPPFLSIRSCYNVLLEFFTDSSYTLEGFYLRYDIGDGMVGGLTMKPTNSYIRSGMPTKEPTILSCSSRANQTDAYPWWSFSTDGDLVEVITAPDCSVLPSVNACKRASLSTSKEYSTRTCNLIISSLYITDAVGLYTCTDATLDYAVALVDVIDPSFTVRALSSFWTEIVQGEQISMTCSVRPYRKTSSYLQFTPSVYIYWGHNQILITESSTTASINLTASAELLPSYVCNINFKLSLSNTYPSSEYATNPPPNISLKLNLTSSPVLYWPESTSMVINGDDNGKVVANGNLTCYVPANPPVTYQWTTKEYGFRWEGPTLAVSHSGTYTCTANNTIRGRPYEASKSINITITIIDRPEDRFNSVALAVGVVLGIAVLLLLVVAIVEFVLLRRKRNSSTMDVNYDFIDAVIRTDAGPAKPHVYELSQRRRLDVDQGGAVGTSGHRGVPPIPPMYDRVTDQTYDTEIHTEDKSQSKLQTYDTEIHTEDKSQTYDTEIHTEEKSDTCLQTYDDEIPVHTEDKSDTYLGLYE